MARLGIFAGSNRILPACCIAAKWEFAGKTRSP
jgi:hypothetical protein